ncbi:VOC family protein [Marinitoga aeolica]|uniref:VOC family protein n=1 Tax=Marinitoga aeolica TaxID=2809031 RepID=A0ABY8PQK7_9BACT|nr:VOC family protein [Marinitoga aeolica]WGS64899.1 VOC family protein [Marinitoga aeolica]
MIPKINLITIWTDNIESMKDFYSKTMKFEIKLDLGNYVEFNNDGVRFALCSREVMHEFSDEYLIKPKGQQFELAFECDNLDDLNKEFSRIISMGGKSIRPPEKMPWNQITAFFADPDGNIHELFFEID